MAAGVVLVEEAGGQVTAYEGTPFDISSGRILATNGRIHTTLSYVLTQVQPWEGFQPIELAHIETQHHD
jgi:myo-inositol-1(or 4)-monophosphatase